jgi:quinol monooxygenase YgiN
MRIRVRAVLSLLSRTLPLTLAVSCVTLSHAVATDAARVLTFIETRSDAAAEGRTSLHRYVDELAGQPAAQVRVAVLQEIARPERFVVLEVATNDEELARLEERARPALEPVRDRLNAPPDRRLHRLFGEATGATPPCLTSLAPAAICVVAHLDVAPPDRDRGEAALQRFAAAARHSAGNLGFEVWQQTDRANHFDFVAAWSSRTNFNAFAAGTAAREFRASVAPLLGSPYDERLYRRIY